jgi:uroporphyrinogen decarboxylase
MNGRERFIRIMDFKATDRLPNYELCCWGQTIERWLSEGMPETAQCGNWFYGDPCFDLEPRTFVGIQTGLIPDYGYEVLAEDERYVTARHPNGITTKALKEGTVLGTRASMDQYIGFPVTNRSDFAKITKRLDPASPERFPADWRSYADKCSSSEHAVCLLDNGMFGLYSGLRSWVGTEGISYLFYDDPAFVEEMLDFSTDFLLATVDRALNDIKIDYFNFFEDFAGKGGPLVSPQLFRKFLMPRYKRIIEHMRRAGVKYFWLDSDGDVEVLIPLLIETGITCLWPLEQASGMDPVRLRKKFGTDLALAGGIDKRELTKDKKSIDAELEARILPMLETGGYIPHLDHAFPPDISYENFLYYLEIKQKLTQENDAGSKNGSGSIISGLPSVS